LEEEMSAVPIDGDIADLVDNEQLVKRDAGKKVS
jgi:hypothetical protein